MAENTLFDIKVMDNGNGSGRFKNEIVITGHWDSVLDALDIINERLTDMYFSSSPDIGDKVTCDRFNNGQMGEIADVLENGFVLVSYPDQTACVVPPESVSRV